MSCGGFILVISTLTFVSLALSLVCRVVLLPIGCGIISCRQQREFLGIIYFPQFCGIRLFQSYWYLAIIHKYTSGALAQSYRIGGDFFQNCQRSKPVPAFQGPTSASSFCSLKSCLLRIYSTRHPNHDHFLFLKTHVVFSSKLKANRSDDVLYDTQLTLIW